MKEKYYLATGMGKLNADLTTLNMHKVHNLLQLVHLSIIPQTCTTRSDPSIRQHSSGLLDNQTSSIDRKGSNTGKVKVGEESVQGGVHAHGGDDNAVGDGEVLDGEGLEEERDLVRVWEGGIDRTEIGSWSGGLFDVVVFLRVDGTVLGGCDWLVDRVDRGRGGGFGGLEGRHVGLEGLGFVVVVVVCRRSRVECWRE